MDSKSVKRIDSRNLVDQCLEKSWIVRKKIGEKKKEACFGRDERERVEVEVSLGRADVAVLVASW